jgi:predicted TIM-barrel fold metal-dependent hydrolase
VLRVQPRSLDVLRGLFSESPDPRQWRHIATGVTYRRAIRAVAAQLGCEPDEEAVLAVRQAMDAAEYAAIFLRPTLTEVLLLDDGYPPPADAIGGAELAELAGCRFLPVLRLETRGDDAAARAATARADGFAALKTIAAYRGGLDRISESVLAALEANDASAQPLPVQVHCGFGDSDLWLPRSDPGWLKPVIERFRETPFVLLHCWPFVRQAAWLAHVYGNVWLDLSLTIPHVARPVEAVLEALELAPVSKLLYGSDAARTPELYLLAATWWRDALAEALPRLLPLDECEGAARMILRENALELYGV